MSRLLISENFSSHTEFSLEKRKLRNWKRTNAQMRRSKAFTSIFQAKQNFHHTCNTSFLCRPLNYLPTNNYLVISCQLQFSVTQTAEERLRMADVTVKYANETLAYGVTVCYIFHLCHTQHVQAQSRIPRWRWTRDHWFFSWCRRWRWSSVLWPGSDHWPRAPEGWRGTEKRDSTAVVQAAIELLSYLCLSWKKYMMFHSNWQK